MCKNPKLFVMESRETELNDRDDLESDIPTLEEEDKSFTVVDYSVEIALKALARIYSASSLRFESSLHGHKVIILFDSGSIHNFLDPSWHIS